MPESAGNLNVSAGLDITAFKTGATELKNQVKNIETSFRASAAVMENWSTTSNGLKERTTSLKDEIAKQKQALSLLNDAYKKVSSGTEADEKQAKSLAGQMFTLQNQISRNENYLNKYDSALKTAEKQEKENSSSLARFKTGFAQLAEQSKKSSSSITSHFGSLKSTIAGFAASFAAGLSIKSIVDATDSAEKTLAQMDAVLKSTGNAAGVTKQQLLGLADAQANETTYSKGATEEAENMLLTFTNIKSSVFPQTVKATEDMATAMKMNVTDAAKTLGKALNDPAAGLSKLTKQGVTFTAEQKEQIKAMQAAGNTAGAQSIILQEITKEFGGSAKAAGDTTSGQIQKMTNSIKGAGVSITMAIAPIVTNVLPSVVKGAQGLAAAVTAHKTQIVGAVTAVANIVKGAFSFVETHGPLVKGALIAIASAVGVWKTAMLIANTVTTVHNALLALGIIQNGAAATAMTVDTAATVANTAATSGGTIATIAHGVALAASKVAMGAATAAQWLFNAALNANPIGIVITLIAGLVAAMVVLFNNNKGFHDWVVNAWNTIGNLAGNVGNGIKGAFVGAWDGIRSAWSNVSGFFGGIWNSIKGGFSALNPMQWGRDLIDGLVNGIKSAAYHVRDAVNGVAQNIRSFLHFSVPDEGPLADFDTYGPDMMASMAQGITNNIGKLKSAASLAARAISSGLSVSANMIPAYAGGYARAPVSSSQTTEHNYYGPQKEITVVKVDGDVIAGTVRNRVSRGIQDGRTSVRGALGYGA